MAQSKYSEFSNIKKLLDLSIVFWYPLFDSTDSTCQQLGSSTAALEDQPRKAELQQGDRNGVPVDWWGDI